MMMMLYKYLTFQLAMVSRRALMWMMNAPPQQQQHYNITTLLSIPEVVLSSDHDDVGEGNYCDEHNRIDNQQTLNLATDPTTCVMSAEEKGHPSGT